MAKRARRDQIFLNEGREGWVEIVYAYKEKHYLQHKAPIAYPGLTMAVPHRMHDVGLIWLIRKLPQRMNNIKEIDVW